MKLINKSLKLPTHGRVLDGGEPKMGKLFKTWFLPLLAITLLLALVGMASAATITLTRPADSGTVTGTYNLSVSLTTQLTNLTRAWFWASSVSTGNTSNVLIGTVDATNADNDSQHLDVNYTSASGSLVLDDSNDYIFTVIAGNSTNNYTDTSTSVTIDNTNPTVTSLDYPASATTYSATNRTVVLSATIDSKTAIGDCTFKFNDTLISGAQASKLTSKTDADDGTNSCSVTYTDVPQGTYSWYVSLTDGTTTTNGPSSNYFTVRFASTATAKIITYQEEEQQEVQKAKSKKGLFVFLGIVLVILILSNKNIRKKLF